ncbi:hypothetical protein MJO29_016814, partial [Puccinia striiformis f. sp. tritici]
HAAIAGVRRDDVAVFADHVALYDEMKQHKMGALVSPKKYSGFVLVTTERLILWAQAMAVNPEVTHYIPPANTTPQAAAPATTTNQPLPNKSSPWNGPPIPNQQAPGPPMYPHTPQPMGYQAPFMYNSYPPHYYGHPPPPMGAQFGYPPNQVSPGLLGGHPKLNQSSRRDHQSIFANSIEGGCRLRTVPQIYIRQPLAGSSPKGFKKAHAQALTSRIGRFEHHLKKTRANNNEA